MLAWVDVFGAKLSSFSVLETKIAVSRIIADNARHSKLFSDRAKELGRNPESYVPPEIGREIYDTLEAYDDPFDSLAYAWGSLIHFSALLDIYADAADPGSLEILREVKKDVENHLSTLEGYFRSEAGSGAKKARVETVRSAAEDKYSEREDIEMIWYSERDASNV